MHVLHIQVEHQSGLWVGIIVPRPGKVTGTRSAACVKLFLLRYGAAKPDISIVNMYTISD